MKHPRLDFARDRFQVLDGLWDFEFDDSNEGLASKWYEDHAFENRINVPYVPQCRKSMVEDASYHPIMWYATSFETPFDNAYIVFGAVDFKCSVFVNGMHVGDHEGGYLPFSLHMAPFLNGIGCMNRLVVRVEDRNDESQLRGKQYWRDLPDRCWYIPSSGIWQSVYLEERPGTYIENILCTPDIDSSMVHVRAVFNVRFSGSIGFSVSKDGAEVVFASICSSGREVSVCIPIPVGDEVDETNYWSPENPVLFRLDATIFGDGPCDHVSTFFGMRKIDVIDGRVFLNNKPYFQRLVLDQGYFPQGLLTGTESEFERDIRLIKDLGFNGVRMHQKIENPLFLHLADKHGLLVWDEVPSGYSFDSFERKQLYETMHGLIERDFNHPCVVCWVPLNESWGVRKICASKEVQSFAVSLYHMVKALDPTRLVSTNDGWEQVESDICAVHDYAKDAAVLLGRWNGKPAPLACPERKTYANGFEYEYKPVFITEFGGVALKNLCGADSEPISEPDGEAGKACTTVEGWGYEGVESNVEGFLSRVEGLVSAVLSLPRVNGYCYTQFTDVFQEINGLVDIERRPKAAISSLNNIFSVH